MSISSNILNNDSRNLLRDEEEEEDEEHGENKSLIFDDDHEEEVFSTNSVRVLLVDSDPNSLLAMNNLLTNFSYQVTSYKNGEEAMSFLKTSKDEIDLVIWDYHMPTINGLEALNTIVKEIDLPVVITSHDHKIETVKKSILCGAYDFLVKPLSKEVVAVLWRHVYRKRIMSKPAVDSNSAESDPEYVDEEGSKNSLELNTYDQNGDKSSSKKPRMQWTEELHKYFLKAIEKLGSIENAVPKQILKTMQEDYGVKGLTRNNVASHLQKHRQNAMKKPNVQQETGEEHHWNNAGPSVSLTPSQPLQNPSLELDTRALYSLNGPNQYFPSRNLTMNNVNNNFFMTNHPLPMPQPAPYIDPFYPRHEQLQQQEYPYSSAQLPSMMPKQEPAGLLRPMEARDLDLIYDAETLPCDPEFFSQEIDNLDFKSNSR